MSSYLWSTGETTASINATTSGNYTVTVTNSNGCTATSNPTVVTVNQAPNAQIYPGSNITICSGSNVTLSTTSALSYTWSNGSNLPTIQVNTAGNYFVTLTGSNGCSATSPVTTVLVTPTPVATITASGPTTICQGSSVVPTVISDDLDAAYAIHRKTLTGYVSLPNYRNYWRVAGYDKEMDNIESIIATTPKESLAEQLQQAMTDEWLRDCTISGNAAQVREQFSAWAQAGVLPIAVMSSTSGGQAKAVAELFAAFES